MSSSIQQRLAQQAATTFVGRDAELSLLLDLLGDAGPLVLQVHGLPGMGKSSLLAAFCTAARARQVAVYSLDCRAVEPTERGLLAALGRALGSDPDAASADVLAARLSSAAPRVVLALDNYEVFGLMDTWLRQVFVPALGDNVRVLLVGRNPPSAAWLTAPGWQGLFQGVDLGPLPERAALDLLARHGVADAPRARRLHQFTAGHPLALTLAAAAVQQRTSFDLDAAAIPRVVDALVALYLQDVDDPLTRRALDAASVVRRTTASLLRAMLPDVAAEEAFERLRAVPFVEAGHDGLVLHGAVQPAIAAALHAADPPAYGAYRRAAWRQLQAEVRSAGRGELWRYTADLLYLVENPVVREAFFPSDAARFVVEPARPEDEADVLAIARLHDGPEAARLLAGWWAELPRAFHVVRTADGAVAGYYCLFDPGGVSPALRRADPIVTRWDEHLRSAPVPTGQRVLFLRRWLGRADGEAPSPVQAACWLDVKRAYMELRPQLRRVYLTLRDFAPYASAAAQLGFQSLPGRPIALDAAAYQSAVLDLGPRSVDGWLAGLVAAELGLADDELLDAEARELVLDGRRVKLTRLELGVLQYLYAREGKAVARAALLEDVWGYGADGGSNVVDVVIRALRKKLGDRAAQIETVSGVGYRFRQG